MKNLKKYLVYFMLSLVIFSPFLVVKAKANLELPLHDEMKSRDYVIYYNVYNKIMLTTFDLKYPQDNRIVLKDTVLNENYQIGPKFYSFENGEWVTSNVKIASVNSFLYSSRDVYNSYTEKVVFKKKIVNTTVMYQTKVALGNLEKNLEIVFGNLLPVGGLILGVLLVVQLVIRLPRWAKL